MGHLAGGRRRREPQTTTRPMPALIRPAQSPTSTTLTRPWRAWGQVRRNRRAPGIDQTTIADIEQYDVNRLLDELEAELKAGAFRPSAARRVFIPKPDRDERRALSIPSVRDRVVQAAVKIVLEPVFE